MTQIIWGSVNADGTINTGTGFRVERIKPGEYTITFNTKFSVTPAVVATQNRFADPNQSNMDGVAVPIVNTGSCQINTGANNSGLPPQDRNFGFIAIGE
ncbi:hypothetical protein [Burkholderia ubonensis]|uniref:hypothetical protein n=1 Tax=Burkholderia ubonensis TaxID=101571 RepID=UPI000B087F42|nr:hypothetical protein [Burkholderia ubonensis]